MKNLEELRTSYQLERGADLGIAAKMLVLARGDAGGLDRAARQIHAPPRAVTVAKAAISALTTANSEALTALQTASSGFSDSLRSISAFDAMLGDMIRVPLDVPGLRISTAGISGTLVAEGAPQPISSITIAVAGLAKRKSSAIVIVSDTLARELSSGASAMLSRELRGAVAAATNVDFLSELVSGLTPIVSSGGSTAAQVYADVEALLDAVPTGATSQLYLIVSPTAAKHLSVKTDTAGSAAFPGVTPGGGQVAGVRTLVSDHLPVSGSPAAPQIMLVDASGVAANTAEITLDDATHAAIQMSSTPSPGAQQMTSLWQTNSTALRASRFYGFQLLRDDAVAVLSGASW